MAAAATPDKEKKMEEGVNGGATSLALFLRQNPNLEEMKAVRESKCGIFKWVDVLIFGFLFFMPIMPVMTQGDPDGMWIVIVLWLLITPIMILKVDYNQRAAIWHICICRGIIVDFNKTNSLMGWLCQAPTRLAIVFIVFNGFVAYMVLDPDFNGEGPEEEGLGVIFIGAVLAMFSVLFALLMTKAFVDLEGAPQLQTLNMVLFFFKDPELLRHKGFKQVHFSRLTTFVHQDRGDANFNWDDVHALSHEPDELASFSLFAGFKVYSLLFPHKDLEGPAGKE